MASVREPRAAPSEFEAGERVVIGHRLTQTGGTSSSVGRTALASAHASGAVSLIAGCLGEDETFDHTIAVFAHENADLTELDDEAHLAALESSRIEAIDDIGG